MRKRNACRPVQLIQSPPAPTIRPGTTTVITPLGTIWLAVIINLQAEIRSQDGPRPALPLVRWTSMWTVRSIDRLTALNHSRPSVFSSSYLRELEKKTKISLSTSQTALMHLSIFSVTFHALPIFHVRVLVSGTYIYDGKNTYVYEIERRRNDYFLLLSIL